MPFDITSFLPMPPKMGPPLPGFLCIYWPKRGGEAWTCGVCGMEFVSKAELTSHMERYLTPLRIYRCIDCGYSFSWKPQDAIYFQNHRGMVVAADTAPTCPECGGWNLEVALK